MGAKASIYEKARADLRSSGQTSESCVAMDPLRQLLQEVASNLSGYPCRVRWRKSCRTDAKAICFRHNNQAVIDLHPSMLWDGDSLLYTICHEAGHVRDLYDEWTNIPDYKSGSIQVSEKARSLPGVVAIEDTADRLARGWIEYANNNYMRYYQSGDLGTFAAKLRALIDWRG